MRDQGTILFRRLTDGTVIGEIVDSYGRVVLSKNFGPLSDTEIRNILNIYKEENPYINILPTIEIAGN